jgi:hypothetical protein
VSAIAKTKNPLQLPRKRARLDAIYTISASFGKQR